MGRPFSMDLRARLIRRVEAGAGCRSVARVFDLGEAIVIHRSRRKPELGPVALGHDRSDAPWVGDGPINANPFLACVTTHGLASTLRNGDIVVIDNLSGHKGEAVHAANRSGAHGFCFCPNSADLNPIEQVFAKLKHLLRKATERTAGATRMRFGKPLNHFPPAECGNYPRNAGYGSA